MLTFDTESKTPPSGSTAAELSLPEVVAQYVRNAQIEEGVQSWHLSGTGPVRELEAKLQQYYGFEHALCVSSATMGIYLTFRALDLSGNAFITTPYTWGGTVAGPLEVGAHPLLVDIDADTLGLDPAAVRRCAEEHPEAKAVLAVDAFGVPSDMHGIRAVADECDLWYIADAAQSFGARIDGRPASAVADVLVTSFTAGKALFAGEGGAILTDSRDLYERLIWISQHPLRQKRELGLRLTNECALNGRIHPVAAIIGTETFDSSIAEVELYRKCALALISDLAESNIILPPGYASRGLEPAFFEISVKPAPGVSIDDLRQYLARSAWDVRVRRPSSSLLFDQVAFESSAGTLKDFGCPNAIEQAKRRLCLSIQEE